MDIRTVGFSCGDITTTGDISPELTSVVTIWSQLSIRIFLIVRLSCTHMCSTDPTNVEPKPTEKKPHKVTLVYRVAYRSEQLGMPYCFRTRKRTPYNNDPLSCMVLSLVEVRTRFHLHRCICLSFFPFSHTPFLILNLFIKLFYKGQILF